MPLVEKFFIMNINALNLLRSYMFRVGSNHNAVRTVKLFLNAHHKVPIFDLKSDSVFDAKTQTALTQFQKSKNLLTTGRMDLRTWSAIGAEMHGAQINIISVGDPTLRHLLTFGSKTNQPAKTAPSNNAFVRNKASALGSQRAGFPKFPIIFYLSAFAPFDWFGPFNLAKGDGNNRRFGTNPKDGYRIRGVSEMTAVDDGTEYPYSVTRASDATTSTLWIPFIEPSTQSECYINDPYTGNYQVNGLHREKLSAEYHLYGNDDAFFFMDWNPISDIDVHPKVWFSFELQANPNNVLMHATGSVIGDRFPAVEAYILDRNNNGVMLGVYQIDANDTPQRKLSGDNRLPMFNIDVKIMVENGIFTGVMKNGGIVSLEQHNSYYTNLPVVTGTPNPPEKVRPAAHY